MERDDLVLPACRAYLGNGAFPDPGPPLPDATVPRLYRNRRAFFYFARLALEWGDERAEAMLGDLAEELGLARSLVDEARMRFGGPKRGGAPSLAARAASWIRLIASGLRPRRAEEVRL